MSCDDDRFGRSPIPFFEPTLLSNLFFEEGFERDNAVHFVTIECDENEVEILREKLEGDFVVISEKELLEINKNGMAQ